MEDGSLQLWDVASGLPLTLPLPHSGRVSQIGWSQDGQRLYVCIFKTAIFVYDFPALGTPSPTWLPELAEAVAVMRIEADDATTRSGVLPVATVREQRLETAADDHWGRWLRWFFADRSTRKASAFSEWSTEEMITRLRTLRTLEGAQEAWRRRPTDPAIMDELADQYERIADTETQGHAKFLRTVAEWNRAQRAGPAKATEPAAK